MNREGLGHEQAVSGLLREREPSQRFTTADQVASAVLFLASDVLPMTDMDRQPERPLLAGCVR